ncbi:MULTISPECIES: IniB N-terminal domain-containing protein [unclassified Micromonospora]|uniref:IniB N-terminal domain-containing protein n=1 Tax=unclassified Micromonospora TaxID=2617518 RepID=UPI0036381A8A
MEPNQTLHDFVLNLLTDPDARSAFDLDPEGALQAAGLHDITAADVQDVVPLVVDYAPVQGLTSLAPVAQFGLDPLPADATDAVGQLQQVAQQLGVTGSSAGVDVKAGVLGTIAVDPATVSAGVTVLPGVGLGVGRSGLDTDLTGVGDVAHTLDDGVVPGVDAGVDPVVGGVTDQVGGLLGTPAPGALDDAGLLDGDLDGVLPGVHGQVGGLIDSIGVDGALGGLGGLGLPGGAGGVVPPVDVPGTVSGLTDHVDGTLSGTLGGATGAVGDITGGVTGGIGGHAGAPAGGDSGLLGLGDGLF